MDVACLGLVVCDILVKPVTAELLAEDSRRVEFVRMSSGGDAFNVAVNLAKLGLQSGIFGKIGADGFGGFLRSVADAHHVDTKGLRVSNTAGTSTSVVMIHPNGERSIAYYGGSSDELQLGDVTWSALREAKLVYVGSAFLLPGLDGVGLATLFREAKRHGLGTALDTTLMPNVESMGVLGPVLAETDLFMPSLKEAQGLAGEDSPEDCAQTFADHGVKVVVIKLGGEGCYIHAGEFKGVLKAFPVTAVDTTGAGDAFVAGFLAAWLKGLSLPECGRMANAVGAACVQAVGATTGILPWAEIEALVKEND